MVDTFDANESPNAVGTKGTEGEKKEDEEPLDEEGLKLAYDVVISGTGLVQSILASALARAGKSVLHCDAADYYGELDAVWTLPYIQQKFGESCDGSVDDAVIADATQNQDVPGDLLHDQGNVYLSLDPSGTMKGFKVHSMKRKTSYTLWKGLVSTPYGKARLVEEDSFCNDDHVSLGLSLVDWRLANETHPKLFMKIPVVELPLLDVLGKELDENDWKHRVDAYFCGGQQQNGMGLMKPFDQKIDEEILDKRSRSFALDVSPGLLYALGPAVEGLLTSEVSTYVEFKSLEGMLYHQKSKLQPVPCSKNDVFASKLLGPMDKRRLMKFLQLALDYSMLQQANQNVSPETSTEEAEEGSTAGASVEDVTSTWNERQLNKGRSLARPQNKAVNTDDITVLQECLESGEVDFESYLAEKQKLGEDMQSLVRYALALDPIREASDRPSLQEGMTNLCQHMQSLGRFGQTAFLVPLYGSGELSQAFCRSAAVYGATYLLRRGVHGIICDSKDKTTNAVSKVVIGGSTETKQSKTVLCKHVVVSDIALSLQKTEVPHKRVLRRISVVRGKPLVKTKGEGQRLAIIFPAQNSVATIHALVLDESVNVSPFLPKGDGCTLIHLSTVIAAEAEPAVSKDRFLQSAVDKILENKPDCEEVFHLTFSYPLSATGGEFKNSHAGLHSIRRDAPALVVDEAFKQARQIYSRICPDDEFLVLAEKIDKLVKERFGEREDDDDEKRVLESAMEIASSSAAESSDQTQPPEAL